MADDDYDVLPMYVEEDEEEAAAEKQKRRQQSLKPPPPPRPLITPEEMARRKVNQAMLRKLHEYDPKLGSGCYTRVYFLDFTKFDIDAENSLIKESHQLVHSLNVLGLKIMSSDVGYPINVYGTVIIRDRLDMKCNYIFRRNRDNCQLIKSQGDSLILTGPSRGVVFLGDAYFEINLKIREGRESDDRQFNKAMIDVLGSKINYVVGRETIDSWLSSVDLIFAYVKTALEGTVEIKILSGPEYFCGKITACTTDVPSQMLLYDSDVDCAVTVGDDRVIKLLRCAVSVSADQMLLLDFSAGSGDGNANISHRRCMFTPPMKGADTDEITCGLYKLRVKVVWSTLLMS
ncbi:uncharacterized protein LOC133908303 [Phragmites australis]|uniref:uncharacterized protein LOC133908303 n=1 Tax=Phragmites australis TaxID=29695 RepID=UPI002D783AB9|nr:uncharacterized protein LOC133908303 [Phragmites australis]